MSEIKKIGLIQSRGLGDLVISLPIAHHYHCAGYQVYWPICEEFASSMQPAAPWINWIPITTDSHGAFYYDVPVQKLHAAGVTDIICLYQALTGHPEFSQEPYFAHTKFDQYKYIQAGVPFKNKWKLDECIVRNKEREQALYDQLVTNNNYVVIHRHGSDYTATVDFNIIPNNWQIIEVNEQTDSVFDWLMILERAQSLIMVDSVFANLVDQLDIGDDRYFIPRSHIGLTPVQGIYWHWLKK
jgi:hypothetical protein